jgi:hypothetical protein
MKDKYRLSLLQAEDEQVYKVVVFKNNKEIYSKDYDSISKAKNALLKMKKSYESLSCVKFTG